MIRAKSIAEAVPQRSLAKEGLVRMLGATWGSEAAHATTVRVKVAADQQQVGMLLEALAAAIIAEGEKRYGDDVALQEVWRDAANEAACAQLAAYSSSAD